MKQNVPENVIPNSGGHFHENLENGLKFYSLNINGIYHMFLIGHNFKVVGKNFFLNICTLLM